MKKIISKILIVSLIFQILGNGVFIKEANALSNTWGLDIAGNYTISDSNSIAISGGVGFLNFKLEQVGVLSNNGTSVFLDTPRRLSVSGDYAFVSSFNPDRIQVIDISNKTSPSEVTNLQNNGTTLMLNGPMGSVIKGNHMYIAENVGDAIQIIDISDPENPVADGNYANSALVRLNGPRGLAISGNYLYVASYNDDAIQIFDITVPNSIVPVGQLRSTTRLNGARSIIVEGNYAYVSSRNDDSIQIIDISNPASPSFVSEIVDNSTSIFLDSVFGIAKSGNYIFATAYNDDGIQVIDVSNPNSPSAVDFIDSSVVTMNGPRELIIDGDNLYIADYLGDSIIMLDISNPLSASLVTKLQNSTGTNLNGPRDLKKVGNFIYVTSYPDDDFVILESKYDDNSPSIETNNSFNYGVEFLNSFSENLGVNNEGNITYQISKDNGATWYYHDGSNWQTTTGTPSESTSASNINTNIESFNSIGLGTGEFKWRAFLNSNGSQKVELDSIIVTSQITNPGGVGTDLSLWLRADENRNTITDGASLTNWSDRSGNGLDAGGGVSPIYRDNANDNINFNPVVDFNGTTQYLENLSNGAHSDSYFMVIEPDNTINNSLAAQVPFGFDCQSGTLNTSDCGTITFGGMALGSVTAAFTDEIITHALGSSTRWRSAETGTNSYAQNEPLLISVNTNSTNNGTDIYSKGTTISNNTANTFQVLSGADYRVGSAIYTSSFFFDGTIAEVINYSSRLSDTDRQKIESYLSLKYGLTLNGGNSNYLASDGTTTMWDTTTAGSYINDIFGVGRDDDGFLGQIKSKSVNSDSIITIEAEGEGTNSENSFNDLDDKEFLTVSNNDGSAAWESIGSPIGFQILNRKWITNESGEIGTTRLDFDVGNANFDIPDLILGTNYFIVIDNDNDGNLNDEVPVAMINQGGNIWRSNSTLLDDGKIFTLATISNLNNPPTDITIDSDNVDENVASSTVVGDFSTVDSDSGDSHTYSLVAGTGDDDNSDFSISGDSLLIELSPDFETKSSYSIRVETDDGNGGTFEKIFTININDLDDTAPIISSTYPNPDDLIPRNNFDITIGFSDETSIDINSDNLELFKWNGSTWGSDISASFIDFTGSTVTNTGASYPTNGIGFGKYMIDFDISDTSGNTTSTGVVFYVDEPEFIVGTPEIDLGSINSSTNTFSSDVSVTVRTVGAPFDIILNRNTDLTYTTEVINSWNGTTGYGYDKETFSGNINTINTNEIIFTNTGGINTDGNKNSYVFNIRIGARTINNMAGGDYQGSINLGIELDY